MRSENLVKTILLKPIGEKLWLPILGLSLWVTVGCTADVASRTESDDASTIPVIAEAEVAESTMEIAPVEETVPVAQVVEPEPGYFVDGNGLAIRGTDPVAYFTEGTAVAGSEAFTYIWGNATWRFASAENRNLFVENPDQYAPQYGGFCAWAVSQGYTASIDPNAWRIVDGRLYLNYSRGVQRQWEQDITGNIRQGDANWPGVLDES